MALSLLPSGYWTGDGKGGAKNAAVHDLLHLWVSRRFFKTFMPP